MWVIAVLMFFSLLIAGGFLFAYIWAVRSGQYDDKYTPSVRILFDDDQENRPAPCVRRPALHKDAQSKSVPL